MLVLDKNVLQLLNCTIVKTIKCNNNTIIVCSTASDPAPLQYLAPYSGCTIADTLEIKDNQH